MAGLNIDRTRDVRLANPRPGKVQPARIAHEDHPKTRLLLAGVCSLLLHVGIAGILSPHQKEEFLNPIPSGAAAEPPAPPPARPESPTLSPAERVQLLEKFKTVKGMLLRRIAVALNAGGGDLVLSDFLIKSRVLDRNIKALESGSDTLLNEDALQDQYDPIKREARLRAELFEDTGEKLDVLHYYAHSSHLRGYLRTSGEILDVLTDGSYNCAGATLFLASLETDVINSKNYGIIFLGSSHDPKGFCGHMLSWFEDRDGTWQIENTDGGYPRRVPYQEGLRAPVEIVYAAYLLRNGGTLGQLPPDLARLYRFGINADGFPLAEAPGRPCPSDQFQPNPYFLGSKSDIIKKARIIATVMALNRSYDESSPETIDLRLINIPEGIDWCKEAEEISASPSIYIDPFDISSTAFRIFGASHTEAISSHIYVAAIRIADLLQDPDKETSDDCTVENEFQKLRSFIEKLPRREDNSTDGLDRELMRALLFPERAREMLLDLYHSGLKDKIKLKVFAWICALHSPQDFELFKAKIMNEPQPLSNLNSGKELAIRALGEMDGENRPRAATILLDALQKETNPFYRYDLVESLAKLGFGMETVRFLSRLSSEFTPHVWKQYLDVIEGRDLQSIENSNQASRVSLVKNIDRLYPDRAPGPEDIGYLTDLVEKEKNLAVKANLIAILALNGEAELAVDLAERLIFPLLLDRNLTGLSGEAFGGREPKKIEAEHLILALARIDSPRIRESLLAVFSIHPELVLEIGDAFVRQNYRSEMIIAELKKILDNVDPSFLMSPEESRERRTYAALLLIMMHEL